MSSRDSASKERAASALGPAGQLMKGGTRNAPMRDSERSQGICGEVIGRYTLHSRIAAGGMASVYLGSMTGAADFSRVVAIKRMHPQFASDPEFVERFRAEAWLSSRLIHPNIVQTFDVLEWGNELLLVMEYIDGVTLRTLCADASTAGQQLPPSVTAGILVASLHGLHAAHIATDDEGRPLGIVHRDFSPHNIIIGRDGHAKILDFGIARARTHAHVSAVGQLSGKFGYLAPEQINCSGVDQRTDVFAAGVVLWESLTGARLFREPGLSEASIIARVLTKVVPPPSEVDTSLPRVLDKIVLRALERDPTRRFATARDMALELEAAIPVASPTAISACMSELSAPRLARLSRGLARTRRCAAVVSRSLAKQTSVAAEALERQQTVVSAMPMLGSVPPPPEPARAMLPRRRRLTFLVAFIAIVGIGLTAWIRTVLPSRNPKPSGPLADVRSALVVEVAPSAAQTSLAMAATSVQPAALPSAGREPEPRPRPEPASTRTTQRGSPQASRPKNPTAPRTSRGGTVAPTKSMCDPPTYLDSEGIRHFKNGCL